MISNETRNCAACNAELVYDHRLGQIKCLECGLIQEDRFIDLSSEYRFFNDSSDDRADPRRVGNSVNFHMDSQIDLIEINDNNHNKNYMTYNLQSNMDKNYTRSLKLIKRYCGFLDIRDNIQKQAEDIYFEIQDKKELKGKKLETTIAAIVYLACKRAKVNIQHTSLEPVAGVESKKIMKASKVIQKFIPAIYVHSDEQVKQFANKLELPRDQITQMEKICKEMEKWDIFECHLPRQRTIAASVLYFYSEAFLTKKKTLSEIKEAAGVATDHTIKKYYNILMEKKDMLLQRALKDDTKE